MTEYSSLPGAEIALKFLAVKAKWPGELDGDMNNSTFSEYEWDNTAGKFRKADPHFTTYINCSDTFFWGSSDGEELTEENIHILEEVIDLLAPLYKQYDEAARAEIRSDKTRVAHEKWKAENPDKIEANGNTPAWRDSPEFKEAQAEYNRLSRLRQKVENTLEDLFAARSRKMRPQGACYSRYPEELWHLFDEAGPERETGFGNPYKPGEYK